MSRRAIEVYPHPATIVLFGLEKTLKYKRGAFEDRQRELLRLMTLIEGLDKATPRLRVNHNVAWVELRKRVEAATRPSQLDRDEDPVDAVRVRVRRALLVSPAGGRDHLRRLRHGLHRHADARRPSGAAARCTQDVNERLTRLAALLQQAQLELTEIRRRLG